LPTANELRQLADNAFRDLALDSYERVRKGGASGEGSSGCRGSGGWAKVSASATWAFE
jgi:hypothetical protein